MGYIKKGLTRAAIPFVIMTVMALSLFMFENDLETARSTFIAGLIVASVAGFSVIYDVMGWSLRKQSAVHFVSMLVSVFPCLLVSGWFETGSVPDILQIFLYFLIVGLIIWGVLYAVLGRLSNR